MIGIPPPDYGTRFTMWDYFIRQATRSSQYTMTPAELTNLARISDSYTPGSIARSVSEVQKFSFSYKAKKKKLTNVVFIVLSLTLSFFSSEPRY